MTKKPNLRPKKASSRPRAKETDREERKKTPSFKTEENKKSITFLLRLGKKVTANTNFLCDDIAADRRTEENKKSERHAKKVACGF